MMDASELTRTALLLSLLSVSVYTDVRHGKIFNKVVLPCIPVGFAIWTVSDGADGALAALAGIGVGCIGLFVAGVFGWIAPGDAKLLVAVGSLMGARFVGTAMILGALAGGVIGLAIMIRRRLLGRWATGMAIAMGAHLPVSNLWVERAGYIPYSIPIAIGCALAGVISF